MAECLIQRICVERVSRWYESYLDCLKDSDCARKHGVAIVELMTRNLSGRLHQISKTIQTKYPDVLLNYGKFIL